MSKQLALLFATFFAALSLSSFGPQAAASAEHLSDITGSYCAGDKILFEVGKNNELKFIAEVVTYGNWNFSVAPAFIRRLNPDGKLMKVGGKVSFTCGKNSASLPVKFEGDFLDDKNNWVSLYVPAHYSSDDCGVAAGSGNEWVALDYKVTKATKTPGGKLTCK